MSKRRNLKKEKAERNKAYARKFRKTSTGNFYRNKRSQNNSGRNTEENKESVEEKNT